MSHVLFPDDAGDPPDRARFGGKAAALAALREAGVAIPPWFVVTPEAFQASLTPVQRATLADGGDPAALAGLQPAPEVTAAVAAAIARIAGRADLLAVRSSAVVEDGDARAFAGQFVTVLSVPPAEVPARLTDVWRSAFSERVRVYGAQVGGTGSAAAPVPAVLVQRMVRADAAGVAFSADPVSGRRDRTVIDAVPGLADRLVAGEVQGDTFHVADDGRIVARALAGAGPCLRDDQVLRVAALARRTADRFGRPQDIEWAFEGGELYLLQSRPITTLRPRGAVILWDNSNIVESYSGVTTPLTFTFARYVYEEVYRQLARLFGVPAARIEDSRDAFRGMLGLLRGRVYYNLLNWYRVLALLPGFAANRRFMEQMMGVDRALPADLLAGVAPPAPAGRRARLAGRMRLAGMVARLLWQRLRLGRTAAAFRARLAAALAEPDPPLGERRLDELAAAYRDLERRLLTRWDAPLVNDFFCMVAFGVLTRLLERWCGDAGGRLRNALLAGDGDVISAEPARRIRAMGALAAEVPSLAETLRSGDDAAAAAVTHHPPLAEAFHAYLDAFGDRCPGELKLENPTLHDEPLPLVRAIGFAAAAAAPAAKAGHGAAVARAELRAHLQGRPVRRLVLRLALAEARVRVRDRENLRFERTRLYGRVRRIVTEMGRRLHQEGLLHEPRQVFHLTIDELLGAVDGTAAGSRLADLARVRRGEFDAYRSGPAPPRRFITHGAAAAAVPEPAGPEPAAPEAACGNADDSSGGGERRQGLGGSPGSARGRVRVVLDPQGAALADGEILVAPFTDPGWITLFIRAAAIVVERGSPLSHSAIVARELGLPAVVALADATTWLRDGDTVVVDGAAGTVTRLPAAVAPP